MLEFHRIGNGPGPTGEQITLTVVISASLAFCSRNNTPATACDSSGSTSDLSYTTTSISRPAPPLESKKCLRLASFHDAPAPAPAPPRPAEAVELVVIES